LHSILHNKYFLILDLKTFTLQYVTSAKREVFNLLTGNSQLTLAAIIKLIDEDFLPHENEEWAKHITAKMKQFLMVNYYRIEIHHMCV